MASKLVFIEPSSPKSMECCMCGDCGLVTSFFDASFVTSDLSTASFFVLPQNLNNHSINMSNSPRIVQTSVADDGGENVLVSNKEQKIWLDLELEIENELEQEIKDGISCLALRLHQLYQHRREELQEKYIEVAVNWERKLLCLRRRWRQR
ncbi:hypothetical protein GIB67_036193 [Kingdonia uniflora]|uniref:Uncharacterized protein n=1 Tax=Kingdonia uniflora TaxID=39325 RepID=A0A7J7MA65_9MAGN|nr:hypothetical protein GIB67_036193 [Kingdonia uniflora]